jgi:hypothetical protein
MVQYSRLSLEKSYCTLRPMTKPSHGGGLTMADVSTLHIPISDFNLNNLNWMHFEGGPNFDYPINYWLAVLGTWPEMGGVDFLAKWEPDSYCHFHRHLGDTTVLALEGEHHVVETTATPTIHKIRKPGHYAQNPGGDVHMEYGGKEGCLVFFSMQAVDGRLFDVLDKEENILGVVTIEDMVSGRLKR